MARACRQEYIREGYYEGYCTCAGQPDDPSRDINEGHNQCSGCNAEYVMEASDADGEPCPLCGFDAW